MTEQEYINVKELGYVIIIIKILHDITVENSECIHKDDFDEIYTQVRAWENRLFNSINIKQ